MLPLVGDSSVVSMRMVVVLPAPFGPRKAKISPAATSKEMSSTALKSPKVRDRFCTLIMNIPASMREPRAEHREELAHPYRMRRPGGRRHQIAIGHGLIDGYFGIFTPRKAHFRGAGGVSGYPATPDHIGGRQQL